ncbi:hypothetical protein [Massilia pseudoviolaceinigra]|uniref:hypothetical protein n=1 Tax=Massilia pseudoviolaceinigra TaxID=3057165 RepID=UPI002796A8DC|nr:hypothetical protein [Massilia sp. CCM 9206]MDQ1920199.1 hypothetical protein [Massilia sp. CCM 9206]
MNTKRFLSLIFLAALASPALAAGAPAAATPDAKAEADFDAYFDTRMKAAQKAMSEKRYASVREQVLELEKALKRVDPDYGEKSQWAYVLDFKRFALYEMGEQEAAVASCRQTVKVLAPNDWPYLAEFNVVRAARRACHNMLAYEQSAVATTVAQHEEAIAQIEQCFATVSPIEDASVLDNFYETRATVYLKANTVTKNKYQEQLFDTLVRADARKLALDEDPQFASIMKTPAYLNFKKEFKNDRKNGSRKTTDNQEST